MKFFPQGLVIVFPGGLHEFHGNPSFFYCQDISGFHIVTFLSIESYHDILVFMAFGQLHFDFGSIGNNNGSVGQGCSLPWAF